MLWKIHRSREYQINTVARTHRKRVADNLQEIRGKLDARL